MVVGSDPRWRRGYNPSNALKPRKSIDAAGLYRWQTSAICADQVSLIEAAV